MFSLNISGVALDGWDLRQVTLEAGDRPWGNFTQFKQSSGEGRGSPCFKHKTKHGCVISWLGWVEEGSPRILSGTVCTAFRMWRARARVAVAAALQTG